MPRFIPGAVLVKRRILYKAFPDFFYYIKCIVFLKELFISTYISIGKFPERYRSKGLKI